MNLSEFEAELRAHAAVMPVDLGTNRTAIRRRVAHQRLVIAAAVGTAVCLLTAGMAVAALTLNPDRSSRVVSTPPPPTVLATGPCTGVVPGALPQLRYFRYRTATSDEEVTDGIVDVVHRCSEVTGTRLGQILFQEITTPGRQYTNLPTSSSSDPGHPWLVVDLPTTAPTGAARTSSEPLAISDPVATLQRIAPYAASGFSRQGAEKVGGISTTRWFASIALDRLNRPGYAPGTTSITVTVWVGADGYTRRARTVTTSPSSPLDSTPTPSTWTIDFFAINQPDRTIVPPPADQTSLPPPTTTRPPNPASPWNGTYAASGTYTSTGTVPYRLSLNGPDATVHWQLAGSPANPSRTDPTVIIDIPASGSVVGIGFTTPADGSTLAGLWISEAAPGGSSTFGVPLDHPVAWFAAPIGQSISAGRVSITRTTATSWHFDIQRDASPGGTFAGGSLDLSVSPQQLPWTRLDIHLTFSDFGARNDLTADLTRQ